MVTQIKFLDSDPVLSGCEVNFEGMVAKDLQSLQLSQNRE